MASPAYIVRRYLSVLCGEPERTLPEEIKDLLMEMCWGMIRDDSTPVEVKLNCWGCLMKTDPTFTGIDGARMLLVLLEKPDPEIESQESLFLFQDLKDYAEEFIREWESQHGEPTASDRFIAALRARGVPVWSYREHISNCCMGMPMFQEDADAAAATASTAATAGFPDLPDLQASQSTTQTTNGPETPTQFSSQDLFEDSFEDAGELYTSQ